MNMVIVRRLINTGLMEQFSTNIRSIISVIIMAIGVYFLEHALGIEGTTILLIVKTIIFVLTGAFLYLSVHLLLWLAAQKPAGPETEVIRMVAKLSKKLKFFSQ